MNKTCIIIAGPTAVGKTSFAINIAQHFSTQIISADSRQCYKELNIGVARPSAEELATIQHHFIASHSITDNFSAADFEKYALQKAQEIFTGSDIAVMVGGTGLYIKAFCEGLDQIPAMDESIRKNIVEEYELKGLEWLQLTVEKEDADFFKKGEIQNPHRLIRALEVKRGTGQSITSYQSNQKKQRNFNIIKIGLEMPRPLLYNRINQRVDAMMQQGLLEEVKQLQQYKQLNALQTVGYRELFDYLQGLNSLDKAVELIKQNSRHYAKRQLTWFKKDEEMQWLNAGESGNMKSVVNTLHKKSR
ncbi:MAG: tRNA (adenosine(37)-N6)-dimethylallyltransferase MiaA [Sphingobacteriales bacterium]|nr:MAG: tRNA (adenosine(37)-N6)-dimethylallyltransferase MiaA [Sphingobacteriales bacterium]